LPICTVPAVPHLRAPAPSIVHASPAAHPHCGASSLHGISWHPLELDAEDADDADDADDAEDVEDIDPPAPPAPPFPEDELEAELDDELELFQPSPPSPPLPVPTCELPTAQAARAKIPSDVTATSKSHRAFIVLPRA